MEKIYVCETGGGCWDGESFKAFKIFDLRDGECDGRGFQYTKDGSRYGHYWCHAKRSVEYTDIDERILFSFKHGSNSFYAKDSLCENTNINKLILSSDFKVVSEEEVEISKAIVKIETVEDIVGNWELLCKNGFLLKQVETCFEFIKAPLGQVYNGEIGIWSMHVFDLFRENIDVILERIVAKLEQ